MGGKEAYLSRRGDEKDTPNQAEGAAVVPYIGSSVPVLLDSQLVAGRGQYTADVSLPGMGYMAVVRSPYAFWVS